MKFTTTAAVLVTGLLLTSAGAEAQSLAEAIDETKFSVNWRLRYEGVDQDGIAAEADAITSRIRAAFETGSVGGTSLLGEVVWVADIIEDFNSTLNGQSQYPVVADPGDFAAVNRFALTNRSLDRTALTLGRQRIVLDDSRFVGNVGWRQNEQTYDGLRSQTDGERFDVDVAYITQVNRVFGPDSPVGRFNGDILLANVSTNFDFGKLTAFAYGVELDEAAAMSSNTIGLRLSGSRALGPLVGLYTASFATQSDAGSNPASYDENYILLEGGIRADKVTVALGYEVLGGNGVNAISTPLATLHAFQGWGDKFLATPAAGMQDSYLRLAYQSGAIGPFQSLSVVGVFHDFEAEAGSMRYGDELDWSLVARTGPMTLTVKYAGDDAAGLLTDTDKFWVSMDYAF
jgi:hypothetical protein